MGSESQISISEKNSNRPKGIDLNCVGLSVEQLDSNPRFQGVSGCSGCITDNTNATAQRPSCCLSCG